MFPKLSRKYCLLIALAAAVLLSGLFFWLIASPLSPLISPIYTEGLIGQPKNHYSLFERLLFVSLYDLSEEIQVENDGKDYIFKLKDASWHNGEPLTAEDVIRNLEDSSEFSGVLKEATDERMVKIFLDQPFAPLEEMAKGFRILPAAEGEELDVTKAQTNGLFAITKVKRNQGDIEELILTCRKGESCGERKIRFRFYGEAHDLELASKLGEISAFVGKTDQPNWKIVTAPIRSRYYALFLNLEKEPLKNQALRQDLARATPKERIVSEALDGQGTTAQGPLDFFPGESETGEEIYPYESELQKDYNLNLTLAIPDDEAHLKTADIIKDEWQKLGIVVNIAPFDLLDLSDLILRPRDFDVLLLGHETGRDPDRYPQWHSTQAEFPGLNFAGFKNMRVDRALEEGREVLGEERRKHYEHFEELLLEEAPAIFLYHPALTLSLREGTAEPDLGELFFPEEHLGF